MATAADGDDGPTAAFLWRARHVKSSTARPAGLALAPERAGATKPLPLSVGYESRHILVHAPESDDTRAKAVAELTRD
jgi:hypothetical protein